MCLCCLPSVTGPAHVVFLQGPPRLTRENEPEEAWGSKFEKDGKNPMSDPLALIGVGAILFPFLLLGVFIATGVIELP